MGQAVAVEAGVAGVGVERAVAGREGIAATPKVRAATTTMMARPRGLRSENFRVTGASWSRGTGRGIALGGGGGGLGAAVGLLAGPGPAMAEPVPESVDGLDQRGPLVWRQGGLAASGLRRSLACCAGGGLVEADAGGGDQQGQQEHDRVLEQGAG